MNVWHLVLCVVILALAYIFFQYARIRKLPEGTDEMQEMAGIIRDGASTFLKTEFRVIAIVVIVAAAVFSLFVEKTSGITFIMGACMSSVVCILGMRSATYANVRTSNRARETLSIGETVKVALGGGSVSGLAVQAFGMLGMVLVLIIWNGVDPPAAGTGFLANLECNPTIMRITTYSLGCSIVAMFNRVAGGNYTKAADISSDILAKLRHDMPEDDSRVPNVIADFIGDNVNDIAGNCSDLLESFVATMAAALMIAVTIYKSALSGGTDVCFCDNQYGPDSGWSSPGAGYFVMNASNTNSGGWKSSQMRTNICGTSLSSYSGTIIAVIPAALRAVLKSVTKYTDNTANGGGSTASYVTATTDYFFLLSEFEVFGSISYGNTNEKNKQAQYAYYSAGNSKIKYKHNGTSTAAHWWLRSPYASNSYYFVLVYTDGTVDNYSADYSLGFAPGFCV